MTSRAGVRSLGAVLGVLMLSGCVGIPTSGNVMPGAIITEQVDPDLVVLPSEPRPGSTQEEILEDFMDALRGPQSGYAIARQYLADDAADEWNPDASTIVRTGGFTITPGAAENSLDYTFTSTAYVGPDGSYREDPPASQTFGFGFVEEDGEWRINGVPDGTVLSQSSFDVVFAEQALYFFDPSYQYLVPDVRWFPSRPTVTSRIVSELLQGPSSWLQQGVLVSAFPIATTEVSSLSVSGTATVDLSPEALTASPVDRDRMRQQLAASLDVSTVEMTVGGIDLQVSPGFAAAARNPLVDPAVLIGDGDRFGFVTDDVVASIPGISDQVVDAGATAATLGPDKLTVAMLTPEGVAIARSGADKPVVVDDRGGLITPTLDPFLYAWSAAGDSAGSLAVFEVDGAQVPITNTLPGDAQVVSIDVSRDGTRLLAYLSTNVGPRLVVAGIIRQQGSNVPIGLGEPFELPVQPGAPVDATWVSDRTVATLARSGENSPVTVIEIGGPSLPLSPAGDAIAIVGGNGGTSGLRVLESDGSVLSPRGTAGWVDTRLRATFLGTKQ